MPQLLQFATFQDALPFLTDKNAVNHAINKSKSGVLMVEIGGESFQFDRNSAADLALLGGCQKMQTRFREEFLGLDGIEVSADWFPELSRTQLAELIENDEANGVPVIVSSFVTGFTYSANSLCMIPSGLDEESVLRLNNLAYHYPSEYRRYGGGVLQEKGAFQTYSYAAIHAGSGATLQYTVRARALRIKNVPGLFRYAQTVNPPESLS